MINTKSSIFLQILCHIDSFLPKIFIAYSYLAPGRPRNVQVLPISFSQLRATWQSPLDPNGVIIGYKITWRMVTDDKQQSVDGKQNETILPSENTSYVINYLGEI